MTFQSLPVEIRFLIYDTIIDCSHTITINQTLYEFQHYQFKPNPEATGPLSALSLTNRQSQAELKGWLKDRPDVILNPVFHILSPKTTSFTNIFCCGLEKLYQAKFGKHLGRRPIKTRNIESEEDTESKDNHTLGCLESGIGQIMAFKQISCSLKLDTGKNNRGWFLMIRSVPTTS